jgi:pimeloyl-ACP methyl ester carboxylesterase
MNIILVPGLFAKAEFFATLRERLEDGGFQCWGPGFHINTLVRDELELLRRRCQRLAPVILVGHSAGGLLSVQVAREGSADVRGVIGLGTPVFAHKLPVPYCEARSVWGTLLPSPAHEVKRFLSLHTMLPMTGAVQDWVVEKVNELVTNDADARCRK